MTLYSPLPCFGSSCEYKLWRQVASEAMPCSAEDENKVGNIGKICFLAAQAGIRWDEKGKRAYILDARSGGASLIEVPNPIDFQGSYNDFYHMLLTSFSYSDATDLFRKLHTPTLLISNSHIQIPSQVGKDKATETCLVINNVPEVFNSVCFVRHFIAFVFNCDELNSSKCTVDQPHRRVTLSWEHRKIRCAAALMWWTSFVASRLDNTKSSWVHAGKQQSTVLCARTEVKIIDIFACSESSLVAKPECMRDTILAFSVFQCKSNLCDGDSKKDHKWQ